MLKFLHVLNSENLYFAMVVGVKRLLGGKIILIFFEIEAVSGIRILKKNPSLLSPKQYIAVST